jgi:hypothetical protein
MNVLKNVYFFDRFDCPLDDDELAGKDPLLMLETLEVGAG